MIPDFRIWNSKPSLFHKYSERKSKINVPCNPPCFLAFLLGRTQKIQNLPPQFRIYSNVLFWTSIFIEIWLIQEILLRIQFYCPSHTNKYAKNLLIMSILTYIEHCSKNPKHLSEFWTFWNIYPKSQPQKFTKKSQITNIQFDSTSLI